MVNFVFCFLMSTAGVKCAVLEKSSAFSRHPQAHFINNRSMEVFSLPLFVSLKHLMRLFSCKISSVH